VRLGLLHVFVRVNFSGVGSIASRSTPNLENHFDLSGMGGSARSLRSRQHSSPGDWGAQTSVPQHGGSTRGGGGTCRIVNICLLL
jgi:hypothetical protein